MNLARNLENAARLFPSNLAIIDGDRRLTYSQMDHQAGLIAAGLAELGVNPGDHVALCAPNSVEWLIFYFGVLKCGAVAVTLSSQLSKEEFSLLFAHSRPRVLFGDDARFEQVCDLWSKEERPRVVAPSSDLDFGKLSRMNPTPMASVERDREETACVLYTGGTTGIPKGVMLSHENINTAIQIVTYMERSNEQDMGICFLPFNHVFGQMHIMNATVFSGGGLVLLPSFDLDRVFAAIAEHRATKLYAVPTIYVRLLQAPDLKKKLGHIRYCFSAAASMAQELVTQWKAQTGLNIYESYGMTETASMVTYNHYVRHLVGSVGTPVGTAEVSIRDQEGNCLPTGREGEICIRARNVMKGYLNYPSATAEAFWGGWLRSGDIGYLDDENYLFIVDRLKDMIISGGENVYSREVEEVLYKQEGVLECAVIGLPDKEYGERVTAYIIPKEGMTVSPDELKIFCKKHLSPFKVPKAFIEVDRFPTSSTGKVLKRELRKEVLARTVPKPGFPNAD
jgi:long-chain acyl-CoA synthetase